MTLIYFDNNSTTRLADEAFVKMNEIYKLPISASATHIYGQSAISILEESRAKVKKALNGDNYELIFTGGASEANNLALFGCEAKTILLCAIEHASVFYCRDKNKEFIEVGVLENGLIDIADLEKKLEKLNHKNFMVTLCLVNNETGTIQNVKEVARLVHKKGGLIHSDVVQAVGKIKVDLEELEVDLASVSAHKVRGPQGVGALLVKKGIKINPIIHGSKQEKSKRAGTHNIAGIAGFAAACEVIDVENYHKISALRNHLEKSLKAIAGDDVMFFGNKAARVPNTCYIGVVGIDKQKQMKDFSNNKICVSDVTGCANGDNVGSNTLLAMKIDDRYLQNTIRVSLGVENTLEEVEKFIRVWGNFYRDNIVQRNAVNV